MNNRLNKKADEQTPMQNLQTTQTMFFKVSWSNFDFFEVKFQLIWMTSNLGQQIAYQQVLTIFLRWKERSTDSKLCMPLILEISYLDKTC